MWRGERGSESVEWIAAAGLVIGAALVAYKLEIGVGLADAAHLLRLTLVGLF